MKRIITFLLALLLLFTTYTTIYADDNLSVSQMGQVAQNMMTHITNRDYTLLLDGSNRSYRTFIDSFFENTGTIASMELVDELIESGSIAEIETEKYMEVMISLMTLVEHNGATDLTLQKQQDNLKTFQDYAMDVVDMGTNAASVLTGTSFMGKFSEGITMAIDGLNTLAHNTENWIKALSDLETVIQDYGRHDAFLAAIEKNSEGNLKQATTTLRNALSTAMELKLESYIDVSNENFQNYSEFFFDDIFFEGLKNSPQYSSDSGFAFLVDGGNEILGNVNLLDSSWELGKQIGTLVGNLAVGGENLINRTREVKVLRDIRQALSLSMYEILGQFVSEYPAESQEELYRQTSEYVALSDYLMCCDLRGEYCLYSIVVNDAGLMSWFHKEDAEETTQWYEDTCALLEKVHTTYFESILQFSDEIPAGAVMFQGHFYQLYDRSHIAYDSWEGAANYCDRLDGYLATITSPEENTFLYQYMIDQGYSDAYFGLSDQDREGRWEWHNGESSGYSNWGENNPQDGDGEDYAKLTTEYADGSWASGNYGEQRLAFICEWGTPTDDEETGMVPVQPSSPNDTDRSAERDIVIVLDASGSMSGNPIEETKEASANFIRTVSEVNSRTGIVTYDGQASQLSNFSSDSNWLLEIVSSIRVGGGTDIEAGLREAELMLQLSSAPKKMIVLMSDGEPTEGKRGEDLIAYADQIKDQGVTIYTLGFFGEVGGKISSAQALMEEIASPGCHYEVSSADDLVFFFEDMADQISGQRYIYIRIACPVDVDVTYNGEILSTAQANQNLRTNFGTITFEQSEEAEDGDDPIKILRLKEGPSYDVQIMGTDHGWMDYTIGFMNENGEYGDFRQFKNIPIERRTIIDTVAAVQEETILQIDEDGDGHYDYKLRATENGEGEEMFTAGWIVYASVGGGLIVIVVVLILIFRHKQKNGRRQSNMGKFCGNCGAPIESGTRVCGQCGTPVEDAFVNSSVSKVEVKKDKKHSHVPKWVGIIAIVLIIVFAVAAIIPNFTGYKGLTRKIMSACMKYDTETIADMASVNYDNMNFSDLEDMFASRIDSVLNRLDVDDWRDADLSYEIEGYFDMPVWMVEAVTSGQAPEDYLETLDEIQIASALLTDDSNPRVDPVRLVLIMVKENGTWKLAEMQTFA